MIRLLIFGDIVARAGREALRLRLSALREQYHPDVIVANVENLAHGKGVTPQTVDELKSLGVQVMTSGNHIWARSEGRALLERPDEMILRPANYPAPCPGKGAVLVQAGVYSLLFINLLGRVFLKENVDDPFRTFDALLEQYQHEHPVAVIVDLHAEATSEKIAFTNYVDGRAALVYGTHTHVPTADARISEKGTAAISDVGMTGAHHSVLGVETPIIIEKFLSQRPTAHEPADDYPYEMTAIIVDINPTTGKAENIEQLREILTEESVE